MWGYSLLTAGNTAIESQYLRDSITGSATGNSREYAVRLRTAGLIHTKGSMIYHSSSAGSINKLLVKGCKPDSQWRLYNDDNYEMAESGTSLVQMVQRTARKILLLTGASLLRKVGQEVKILAATGSSKQSFPYEWTREDFAGDAGSIPVLSNMWSISSMAGPGAGRFDSCGNYL